MHTQGPLGIFSSDEELGQDGTVVRTDNNLEIRPIANQKLGDEIADLKLFCAAPDLLQACQAIVAAFDSLPPNHEARMAKLYINQARSAIAEATGA